MLQDYEIKRKTSTIEKLMPYMEFILILIILQAVILLFTNGPSEEEIRFRLLANSNTLADQEIKEEIQQKIEPLIEQAVVGSRSLDELGDKLAVLEEEMTSIASVLANGMPVKLERTEALFPAKRTGLIVHPQAVYDSYIMTIGSGRGDNWWCAMFPKVCFQEEQEVAEVEEEKVTFFIWEWIKGLFSESY